MMFKMIRSPGAVRAIAAVFFAATWLLAARQARAERSVETATMPVFFSIPDRNLIPTEGDFPLPGPGVDLDGVSAVFVESFIVSFGPGITGGRLRDEFCLNLSLVDAAGDELLLLGSVCPVRWNSNFTLVFDAGLFGCTDGVAGLCNPVPNAGVATALRISGTVTSSAANPQNFVFALFGNAPDDMLTLQFFRGPESLNDAAGTHAVRRLTSVPEQCTSEVQTRFERFPFVLPVAARDLKYVWHDRFRCRVLSGPPTATTISRLILDDNTFLELRDGRSPGTDRDIPSITSCQNYLSIDDSRRCDLADREIVAWEWRILQDDPADFCATPFDPMTFRFYYDDVNPPDCSTKFRRGDTDGSGIVDISDAIFNLTFQFVGGIDELPCEDAADVDDSGVVDISDPVYNLTFQFVGGIDAPLAPGPTECGLDPTDDELSCQGSAAAACP